MTWMRAPNTLGTLTRHDSVIGDNTIYTAGTYDSCNLQRLDPREGEWSLLKDMLHITIHPALSTLNQTITCIGGNTNTSLCQVYDIRMNKWVQLANLPILIQRAKFMEAEERIIVVGGTNTKKIQVYDKMDGTWRIHYLKTPGPICYSLKVLL
uniref:Kelch-like protein 42 n=1 Tax=Rhabditophanes sp. KR3021 TaxID=114890 RepID=A0AC35TUT1_9BILA